MMKKIITLILLAISTFANAQISHDPCLFIDNGEFYNGYGYPDSLLGFVVAPLTDTTFVVCIMNPDQTQTWYGVSNTPQPYGNSYFIPLTWSYDPGAASIFTGTATLSGDNPEVSFDVTHELGFTPTSVFIQPTSLDAAAPSFISEITATTFTVTYITSPEEGEDNITFFWTAQK